MKISYQLSMDLDLKARLRKLSDRSGVPMAKLVNKILRDHLPDLERQYPALQEQTSDRQRARR
ncbi:MAG: hypothetical protein ACREA0_23320 [bacterium]